MKDTACPDCVAAGLRAKTQGFRDWRTGYACYEHAAVSLDTPEWREQMANISPAIHAKAVREMAAYLTPAPALPSQLDPFAA